MVELNQIEKMFGKGKKLKDLTKEQMLQYRLAMNARCRERNGVTVRKLTIVEKMFGKGVSFYDLTVEQRRQYGKSRTDAHKAEYLV
jgi:hypothetical protein|tara:strand:- start:521 stop:778 length:258 start_codon:yes stop_codon:yes gene_type:complete